MTVGIALRKSLSRIRGFLRDPDGDIWTNDQILQYWNRALIDIEQKTGVIEVAESFPFPSQYTYAITYAWERQFVEGDIWEPFDFWEAGNAAITYVWEAAYWQADVKTAHSGYVITQPWEAKYVNPDNVLPVQVNQQMSKVTFASFDEQTIKGTTIQSLGGQDQWYKTRKGECLSYYWWNETDMQIGLYPNPPVILDTLEIDEVFDDEGGIVLFEDSNPETSDTGYVTNVVETDDTLFMVYKPYSQVDSILEEVPYPEWTRHYLEIAVLEYAFGADTDGFIPSLRDYWQARKEIGYKILHKLHNAKMEDRNLVRGAKASPRRYRHPRFPAGYPEPRGYN